MAMLYSATSGWTTASAAGSGETSLGCRKLFALSVDTPSFFPLRTQSASGGAANMASAELQPVQTIHVCC